MKGVSVYDELNLLANVVIESGSSLFIDRCFFVLDVC